MKKKLVQINVVCNGSTGKIMNAIQKKAIEDGWEAYSFFGRGKPANENCFRIGNKFDILWHVFITRLFDKHGHASKRATKKLIKQIEKINPDVIQLHNIHGYYLNIEILFNYLKTYNKKIVWTLHDCWAFTGHCAYFTMAKCDKWKKECYECSQRKGYPSSLIVDSSKREYGFKKELFSNIPNLTIVTPSKWLKELVKESYLNSYETIVINNGIDLDVFKPSNNINILEKYKIPNNKKILLGVAAVWDKRKGLDDFIELSKRINDEFLIVLIGLNRKQIKKLPDNILGIKRTENQKELAELYSVSKVLFNPSKEETFSLITIEAMACGTPIIAYDNSAVKELITEENKGLMLNSKNNKEDNIKDVLNYLEQDNKVNIDLMQKYSINSMTSRYLKIYEE